ncbi:hypothetical protein ACFUIZ_14875 [Streptomyces cinereoruber]|uniref:hypothetical protein n=1 Tax=Streptomyces cinereoruber TaxID=67260 RepID=UPI00362C997B
MRKELYAQDPGIQIPALEAATVSVHIVAQARTNYLSKTTLAPVAAALRIYIARRCLHNGDDGLPGNEVARYLQQWALPADDPRHDDQRAPVGWGLLWDLARRPGFGVHVKVGYGAPWPSVRDPHAGAPSEASCRASV